MKIINCNLCIPEDNHPEVIERIRRMSRNKRVALEANTREALCEFADAGDLFLSLYVGFGVYPKFSKKDNEGDIINVIKLRKAGFHDMWNPVFCNNFKKELDKCGKMCGLFANCD